MTEEEHLQKDIDDLQEENTQLKQDNVELQGKLDDLEEYISHELNGHILVNDEESWNLEFYTNGVLDYKKICIKLLNDILLEIKKVEE